LIKMFERILKEKKIIICLDEVDQLKESTILYVLARNACGLILDIESHPFSYEPRQ